MKKPNLVFLSGILANTIDHYDVAIYALLAPFLAPVFFKESDPAVALILTYSLTSLGIFTRPIGAFLFGRMAIDKGPKPTLIIILVGITLSTIAMGLIPGYASIGPYAAVLLAILRMIQGLFAAGELSVACMFFLEQQNDKKLGRASSFYSCGAMLGIGIASIAATIVSNTSNPEYYWRYAFFSSSLMAIPTLGLRFFIKTPQIPKQQKTSSLRVISTNRWKLLSVILVSSLSYVTYAVPFVFMNSFVPYILPITNAEMLEYNSLLTIFDVGLILIFGIFVDRFPHHKWMALFAGLVALTAIPLFYLLPEASLLGVNLIRAWIVILGVAYSAPLKAWFFKLIDSDEKYLITGLGYTIGSELLGRNTTVICWSLFYYFQSPLAPAFYIASIALCACVVLLVDLRT